MKKALPTLPVRSIGVSGRSVTGIVPLMGRFESTLERDLMELVRFDRRVSSFLPQPVKIEYKGDAGEDRLYTPDGLITFQESASSPPPILYEVKYRANFREQWRNLLPKFRAAKSYCAQRGGVLRSTRSEKSARRIWITSNFCGRFETDCLARFSALRSWVFSKAATRSV